MSDAPHILFLDDDPERAGSFLADHPGATWVETVAECIGCPAEPWYLAHLDHDLGGKVSVDIERDDCGMAVVRWLCREPQPHFHGTRFVVHSNNDNAACVMALNLQVLGFDVESLPFGSDPGQHDSSSGRPGLAERLIVTFLGRLLGRR